MAKGIMRSTKTRDGIAAALAYNLGDLEEDQYQIREEWAAQHSTFADMQDALEQAGLRVLNRPNLTNMGRNFWTTRAMPTSAVVANTYTIPIEDATAAAETLTYTITDEAITSSFSIFQKISSDSTNVPSSLVTATFAAGVATVTIAARSAHSAAVTIKLWLCTSANATVPYGSATRISGTSYPYLKSIQQGAYPGDDSADGIVCSVITLTGTDIITETDGEIFDRALQFNISANSAYGNTEWLLSGYPYPTTKYGNGQIPKNYGQITELTPGERYTIAFRARVISGEKAIARFGFGGGFYSNSPNSNPADGRTGLSDWIEISGSEWKWYSWTFDYNPTGDWYTEAQTTENNLTYTIRTYAYAKKIGFGIGRKYNAVIQLAAFRCVQGRLYITDTYDDLEEAVTALRGRATALETASDEVPGAISAAKAAVLGIVAESDTATATANHVVGDLFVMGDVLYKTTAAIAIGETITPGTNCDATTIATEIEAAASGGASGAVGFGVCYTAAATGEKIVSIDGWTLETGAMVCVQFANTDTAYVSQIKLNVNSTGAKMIYYSGSRVPSGFLSAYNTYLMVYDGEVFRVVGMYQTGRDDSTVGTNSLAYGEHVQAVGSASQAFGYQTIARGSYSHAEGNQAIAYGSASHAEGAGSVAAANASHAEGTSNVALSSESHVSGRYNLPGAGATAAWTSGVTYPRGAVVKSDGRLYLCIRQHISGRYTGSFNVQEYGDDGTTLYTVWDDLGAAGTTEYAEIIGNGTPSVRSNARTLDWRGNEWLAGNLTLGSTTLTEAQLQALLALLS